MDHGQPFLQSMFESSTRISAQVHAMLADLNKFHVQAFRPFHAASTEEIPLQTRMRIMSQAIVALVLKSVPKNPGVERTRCIARVRQLSEAFKTGVKLLTQHSDVNRRAMNDPSVHKLIASLIDRDMEEWTRKVQVAVATLGHETHTPPTSERELPPVPVPEWVNLAAFLSSGALVLANTKSGTQSGNQKTTGAGSTRGKTAKKMEDCQRFLQGKCNKDNCKYRHPKSQAAIPSQPAGSEKRSAAKPTTAPAPKKAKGAKTQNPAKGKAKAAVTPEPDAEDSE